MIIKEEKDILCLKGSLLVRYANGIAGFYGHPVYLVGSQLYKDHPRDVDLACIIPNNEFVKRYINQVEVVGTTDEEKCEQWGLRYQSGLYNESNWAWAKDVSHKSLQGMDYTRMAIDLKVYPQQYQDDNFGDKPKLKISQD